MFPIRGTRPRWAAEGLGLSTAVSSVVVADTNAIVVEDAQSGLVALPLCCGRGWWFAVAAVVVVVRLCRLVSRGP